MPLLGSWVSRCIRKMYFKMYNLLQKTGYMSQIREYKNSKRKMVLKRKSILKMMNNVRQSVFI